MSILNVQKLVKRYPAFELKEVSFSLDNGRITGFIGRNGAGKTTTIKSMLGMIHPDNGTVEYFGKPFFGNEAEIKRRIGYSTGTVAINDRGQIVIPKGARDQFGLSGGQRLIVLSDENGIALIPDEAFMEKMKGVLEYAKE